MRLNEFFLLILKSLSFFLCSVYFYLFLKQATITKYRTLVDNNWIELADLKITKPSGCHIFYSYLVGCCPLFIWQEKSDIGRSARKTRKAPVMKIVPSSVN